MELPIQDFFNLNLHMRIIQAWFQDGWKQGYGPRLSRELQLSKQEQVADIQPSW